MEELLQGGLKIFVYILIGVAVIGFLLAFLMDNDDFDEETNDSSEKSNGDYQKHTKKERKKTFQGTMMYCSSCGSEFPEHKVEYRYDNDRENDWQDTWEERREKEERNGREKSCPVCYSGDIRYA